jgi:RimJ/RimL family protein N-acetyltransferase
MTRFVARTFQFYGKEVEFYRTAAARSPLATPRCLASAHDPETDDFVLLLEDLGDAEVHSQLDGCPVEVAETAVRAIAGHHAEFWVWPAGSPYQRGQHLPDTVYIGTTWLAADAQRTGINTEAKLLMLTLAFETWLVHRVRIQADSRNERSCRAILRLGMHLDGVIRADRVALDGAIRNSATYSFLDSEWPEVKAQLTARLH